ncbi:MAG: radical SAM protein [Clostridiales bacterium]|nr:radical SAM protein [Clostridiales bacterium]
MTTREELTTKYAYPFTDFDFSKEVAFDYCGDRYDLTDEDSLCELIAQSKSRKDYAISKIANNILAVAEMKRGEAHYRHLPVIMHVELTDMCNSECMMCKHCYEKNINAKSLSAAAFEKLTQYFPTCKLVVINGYGEPFIHPDISNIISAFDEYGVKIMTTSNAQRIPLDSLEKINDTFLRINVSCDGATEKTYQSIRRRSSFERFKQNVKALRENCPNVELFMSVVAMRQNIHEAVDLVRLAHEYGFKEIRFGRLGSNVFLNNETDELIYYPNYASMMFGLAKEEGDRLGVSVIVPLIMKDGEFDPVAAEREKAEISKTAFYKSEEYYDELGREYVRKHNSGEFRPLEYSLDGAIPCEGICHWAAFGMYVNASGKVRPCAEIPYNREQEEREEEIDFNAAELCELRRRFVGGRVPKVCMDCAFIMSDEVGTLKVDLGEYKKYFSDKANKSDKKTQVVK